MSRMRSSVPRWLWEILEGETAGAAPDERQPLHAGEEGMLVFVSLLTVVFFLALVALVGNVGRTVNQKIEVQNTADAVAQSGALWIARGLNSITATNHLIGELMSFVVLIDGLGVRGKGSADKDARDQAKALKDVVEQAKDATTGTYAYDRYLNLDPPPLGNGGPLVQTYTPDDADSPPPPAIKKSGPTITAGPMITAGPTITAGKKNLINAFISIYGTKAVAAKLEKSGFPPAIIAGYVLDFTALAVELYALAEWFVLDVIETIGRGLLADGVNLREVIFGAHPGDGLLAGAVKYTRTIHDALETRNQVAGLVDRSAGAIGAVNSCDAAVVWGPQALPIAPESFGADDKNQGQAFALGQGKGKAVGLLKKDEAGDDDHFEQSQLVRATWPWVVYHRRPILHMTRWMRLSRTPILYRDNTTYYALGTCRQFYARHQLYLYVIDDPGNPGKEKDKGKGHESWATDSDRAAYLFGVFGFAHRKLPQPFAPGVFGQANSKGITAYAQAFVYNANFQDPDPAPRDGLQPMVGWDTLNWSAPIKDAYAYEYPYDPQGVKNLWKDKKWAPRVYLNWQAKLVPVSTNALKTVLTIQPPRLPADKFPPGTFNLKDPLPPSFRTH